MDSQSVLEKTIKNGLADEQVVNDKIKQSIENKFKRKYDIVVFGASGFTGQFVVKEMNHFSQVYNLTWAIAGRNSKKLKTVLDNLSKVQDGFEDKAIDIIYADVQDIKTILKMTQSASVIINCTGPYYIYGEVVVKSCVLNSTHYVDVTGESLFMEKMAYLYNSEAEVNRSIIVSALGMESVPADLGIEFLYKSFEGELQNVDTYMQLYSNSYVLTNSAFIHDGTWISAILHLATRKQRIHYRNLLDESMGINRIKPTISKILHKQQIRVNSDKKEWCLAFPEPDQAVIVRSLHHARTVDNLPYNFEVKTYMVFGSLIASIIAVFVFFLLSIMAAFEPIRILFVRFPKIFSLGIATKTGPKTKIMENSRLSLTLIGYGSTSVNPLTNISKTVRYKNNATRKTVVKVKAKNPGYGFTSKAVVLGAITLLIDRSSLPKGGILTPAAAFRNSQYVERLMEHDAASFEIESDLIIYKQQAKLI